MSVIAVAGLDTVREYSNGSVKAKIGNKNHQVFFRVLVDSTNIGEALSLAKKDSNIIALEYTLDSLVYCDLSMYSLDDVYVFFRKEFGTDICIEDVNNFLFNVPAGVTPVIKVPDSFNDMEFVCKVCEMSPEVRFCGGYLFEMGGCRLGCCGSDILESKGIKCDCTSKIKDGCGCGLPTYDADELNLVLTEKVARVPKERRKGSSAPRQKTLKFGDILFASKVSL